MLVIPAIDLRQGRCVRLNQGRADKETVFSDDPLAVAARWESTGAPWIHVVDLDGAFEGRPQNIEVIRAIAEQAGCKVQMGGGLRTLAAIDAVIDAGVERVILGTAAIEAPKLVEEAVAAHPGRILIGIDARDGQVAVRGWVQGTARPAAALARQVMGWGVEEIVFTDIASDGMLRGPNYERLGEVLETGVRVIAAGGVSTVEDVRRLSELTDKGLSGCIIGKALYTGDIDLSEALAVVGSKARG